MNPALLINIIQSLVVDKAQSLAVEHVTKAIDDNLNDTQKKMLDYVVEEMPDNSFKEVCISDYSGKKIVLFFYPLDFTFV